MKSTYYITRVQIGLLKVLDEEKRNKLLDSIIKNQHLDNELRKGMFKNN